MFNCNAFSPYARSSDIMQPCPGLSAVWSLHMCAYATVWSLFEALLEHVLYHLGRSACSSHTMLERVESIRVEHLTAVTKHLRQRVTSLYTCVCYLLLVVKTPFPSAFHMTKSNDRIRCIILAGQGIGKQEPNRKKK